MSFFAGIEKSPMPTGGGTWFQAGKYLVELKTFTAGSSQKGDGAYAAVESEVKKVYYGNEESNSLGQRVSWVQMLQKYHQTAFPNVKAFVSAACGCAPEEVTEEICEKATEGDGTLLAGTLLIAEARTIVTKKGNEITIVDWSTPTEEQLAELPGKGKNVSTDNEIPY